MKSRSQIVALCMALAVPFATQVAQAGCGCEKPPPARAVVRPFVAHSFQTVTVFDEGLSPGEVYRADFRAVDGTVDWSQGRARLARDLADGAPRIGVEVLVPPLPLGPAAITVYHGDDALLAVDDATFTIGPAPIDLQEVDETIVRDGYQAAVGRDGTLYVSVNVKAVSHATTFVGSGQGYPVDFSAADVSMYNDQGYLMQLLDPTDEGLFTIYGGSGLDSNALQYWRHEFETYKRDHRRTADRGLGNERHWHNDGTPHVNHDHIVVAIRGQLADGTMPVPGATPPFALRLESIPD